MKQPLRCAVCARILAIAEGRSSPNDAMYCPDRICYLYPSTAKSRAEDPTMASWLLAIHYMTTVTDTHASQAAGKNDAWARGMVTAQRKRWKSAY